MALLEKAIKGFEEQATKDPKDHLAPYNAANAHITAANVVDVKAEGDFDKTGAAEKHIDAAMELIKTSVDLKGDNVDAHVLRYHVLSRKVAHVGFPKLMMFVGDLQASLAKAQELGPDNLDVGLISALSVASGFPPPPPEKPIAEFEKLLKKDPKMAEAYYQIGLVWEKAKKMEDAKKNLEKAVELDANHHWAKKKLKAMAAGAPA
jgi:tetratricopeptide (TPR) repeat protein